LQHACLDVRRFLLGFAEFLDAGGALHRAIAGVTPKDRDCQAGVGGLGAA